MLHVKFMTLSGKFSVAREAEFANETAAREAVELHAASAQYTNVAKVEDGDSVRFTARTPGGRGGRNIAFMDFMDPY